MLSHMRQTSCCVAPAKIHRRPTRKRMYPTDDRLIRVRLLIKQSQEARERMMKRVEESRTLRARAAQRLERPESATDEEREQPESRGGARAMT